MSNSNAIGTFFSTNYYNKWFVTTEEMLNFNKRNKPKVV